jgi:aldehyde:ferredoxin oxidoreductase
MAKRVYNIREGWQPSDDWLPDRLLNEPLTLPSGRQARLTPDRLRAMIDSYYTMRGLDREGRPPDPAIAVDLGLG